MEGYVAFIRSEVANEPIPIDDKQADLSLLIERVVAIRRIGAHNWDP